MVNSYLVKLTFTAQKMKFSIKDLLKKSLVEKFIFCVVFFVCFDQNIIINKHQIVNEKHGLHSTTIL